MSLQDAANLVTVAQGQNAILNDRTMNPFDKARALEAVQSAASASPQQGLLSVGDLVRGAIGAGLGYGASTLLGSMVGADPSTLTLVQRLGMGLGTLMNTGLLMNKMSAAQDEKERRHAFRLGFVRAAMDLGLVNDDHMTPAELVKDAGVVGTVPIVEAFKTPIDFATNIGGVAATTGGALLGHLTGDTQDDVDLTNMAIQDRELQDRANRIQQGRQSALLKQVLDKRVGRR
jgi:hypothetical protein